MYKKGQLTIVSIIMWVMLVIVAAVMTPIVQQSADTVVNSTNNSMTQLTAQAITPVMWIGVIASFFVFVQPQFGGGRRF